MTYIDSAATTYIAADDAEKIYEDEDLIGYYSAAHASVLIIDIDSGMVLTNFVHVENAAAAAKLVAAHA